MTNATAPASAHRKPERRAHFQDGKSVEDDDHDDDEAGEVDSATKPHQLLDNRSATSQTTRSSLTLDEANDDEEDDEDDDDDEETRMRAQAFQRNQSKSLSSGSARASQPGSDQSDGGGAPKRPLVHRFDEYGDFLSRSERSRRDKATEGRVHHDHDPRAHAHQHLASSLPPRGRTTKVRWPDPVESSVRFLPELTYQDSSSMYMAKDAWERIDLDVEMTKKRYDNHAAGLIPFDLENNTVRGLECALDDGACRRRDAAMRRHATAVLREQNRQRVEGEFYDSEKMRAVASGTALPMRDEALERGRRDAEDAVGVWSGATSEASLLPAPGSAAHHKGKPASRRHPPGGKKKKTGGSGSGFSLLGLFQGKSKKK
jgi:hypothetical protein